MHPEFLNFKALLRDILMGEGFIENNASEKISGFAVLPRGDMSLAIYYFQQTRMPQTTLQAQNRKILTEYQEALKKHNYVTTLILGEPGFDYLWYKP